VKSPGLPPVRPPEGGQLGGTEVPRRLSPLRRTDSNPVVPRRTPRWLASPNCRLAKRPSRRSALAGGPRRSPSHTRASSIKSQLALNMSDACSKLVRHRLRRVSASQIRCSRPKPGAYVAQGSRAQHRDVESIYPRHGAPYRAHVALNRRLANTALKPPSFDVPTLLGYVRSARLPSSPSVGRSLPRSTSSPRHRAPHSASVVSLGWPKPPSFDVVVLVRHSLTRSTLPRSVRPRLPSLDAASHPRPKPRLLVAASLVLPLMASLRSTCLPSSAHCVNLAYGASLAWPKPRSFHVIDSFDGQHSFDVTSCSKPKPRALHVVALVMPKPHSFDVSPQLGSLRQSRLRRFPRLAEASLVPRHRLV